MLLTVAGLVIACHVGRAQELLSRNDTSLSLGAGFVPASSLSPGASFLPASSLSPNSSYAASLRNTREASNPPSWLWVHTGVAMQVAGSFADWATSWKQPEGNQLLAESGGQYAGRFYRTGTVNKVALSAGLAAVSYAVACKWPKMRKYVGVFNMSVGAGYGAAAVSNVVRNPYYKP
jgi:hypothetical protein